MSLTILAHGGQMTGDEMAIMGGGLSFAILFPVAALIVVTRRGRKKQSPDDGDGGDAPATTVAPENDPAERT